MIEQSVKKACVTAYCKKPSTEVDDRPLEWGVCSISQAFYTFKLWLSKSRYNFIQTECLARFFCSTQFYSVTDIIYNINQRLLYLPSLLIFDRFCFPAKLSFTLYRGSNLSPWFHSQPDPVASFRQLADNLRSTQKRELFSSWPMLIIFFDKLFMISD